jgi:hypothetical protein
MYFCAFHINNQTFDSKSIALPQKKHYTWGRGDDFMNISGISPAASGGKAAPSNVDGKIQALQQKLQQLTLERQKAVESGDKKKQEKLEKQIEEIKKQLQQLLRQQRKAEKQENVEESPENPDKTQGGHVDLLL